MTAETSSAPRRYRLRARLVALALALLAALVIGEVAVRILFRDEIDTDRIRERQEEPFIGNLIEPSGNPELLYELRKGLEEEWRGVLVATDASEPRRVSTFMDPPADPAIRIAVIGDSSSFGWAIEYESCYAEICRQELEVEFGVPIELRNYGVPGYGSLQERIRFEETVLPWKPDIVILHYDHNDPNTTNTAPVDYMEAEYGDNFLRSGLIKLAMRRLRILANQRTLHFYVEGEDPHWKEYRGFGYAGVYWEAHLAELARIGKGARENGILPVALIYCYDLERTAEGWDEKHAQLIHDPLTGALESAGFHVLDTHWPHRSQMESMGWGNFEPFLVSPEDPHPSRSGHAFLGAQLYRFLMETPAVAERLRAAAARGPAAPGGTPESAIGITFRKATALAGEGKLAEAEAAFRELVAVKPSSVALRARLLQVQLMQGRTAEAEAQREAIARLKSDYVEPLRNLARYYASKGDLERAIAHLETAVERSGSRNVKTQSIRELGDVLFAAGRTAEAEEWFYRARELVSETDPTPIILLAENYVAAGKWREAETHLEAALRIEPEHREARNALAKVFETQRRAGEAIPLLEVLLESDPGNTDYLTRLALLLATSHDEADHDAARAVSLAEEACRLTGGRDARALTALAVAQADAGAFAKAVVSIEKAMAHHAAAGNAAAAKGLKQIRAGFERGNKVRSSPPEP